MANSIYEATGDGSTTDFTIPYTYLEADDVTAFVGGVSTSFTFTSDNVVTFASAPANGVSVRIVRNTDVDALNVTYSDGGALTAEQLNDSNTQLLFGVQEAIDVANEALSLDVDGVYNAQHQTVNRRIKNIANPVNAQDAATKDYLENTWLTSADKTQLNLLNTTNLNTVANSVSNVNTVASNISNVNTVGGISADVTTVSSNISDVQTVADDLNEPVSEIETVANNITNVNTVGGISTDVTTVAGIASDVTAVAADTTDIGTVSSNIANVNTVAGISSDVTTVSGINAAVSSVAADATDIGTVSSNIANVNTVAGILADVTTVAADSTDIGTVATNITNVNTVAGISGNVTTVAGISADVTAVAGISGDIQDVQDKLVQIQAVADDLQEVTSEIETVAASIANVDTVGSAITNVNTVATNVADVNTVAGISSNVNTVAGISANVTTVAGISSDVTAVAADATDIGTVATNLAGTDTIGTVATNIANVNSVGGSISNVNTVATNINSVNDFADKYRIGASDPTTDNDEGDLFYNTTSDTLKVYTGTAWEQGVTAGSGFLPLSGGAMTGTITFDGTQTFDGRDVSADGAKLDGIEAGATADQTASEILTAIKTVDGASSGLDADLLDGQHGSYYYPASNPNGYTTNVGDITGVTAGTNLTGGGTSGTVTLNMATGGIGSGTYGSTDNGTKIDTITVDAYGRVTAVATGDTGDIQGVTAGNGLTGGGTTGTPTLNVGAGTGVTVAADTVSIGQDVATTASPSFGGLNINGNINAVDSIYLARYIFHEGDTDTYIDFVAENETRVVTGGSENIRFRTNYIQCYENVVGSVEVTSRSGAFTPDFQNANSFVWTLTGNITLNNPSTEIAGMSGVFVFIHSGAARTVSLGGDYETAGGAGLTLSGTAGAVDIVPYFVQASGNILLGTPQLAFS